MQISDEAIFENNVAGYALGTDAKLKWHIFKNSNFVVIYECEESLDVVDSVTVFMRDVNKENGHSTNKIRCMGVNFENTLQNLFKDCCDNPNDYIRFNNELVNSINNTRRSINIFNEFIELAKSNKHQALSNKINEYGGFEDSEYVDKSVIDLFL